MPALVQTVLANQPLPYWGVTASICMEAPVNEFRIQERFEDKSLQPMHQSAVYCFGAGYWISAAALPAIVAASSEYETSALEDVCTGYVMNRAGWTPRRHRVGFEEVPRNAELLSMK